MAIKKGWGRQLSSCYFFWYCFTTLSLNLPCGGKICCALMSVICLLQLCGPLSCWRPGTPQPRDLLLFQEFLLLQLFDQCQHSFCSPRWFLKTLLPGKLWKEEAGQHSPDVSIAGHSVKGVDWEACPRLFGFALLAQSVVSIEPVCEADTWHVKFKDSPQKWCHRLLALVFWVCLAVCTGKFLRRFWGYHSASDTLPGYIDADFCWLPW